MHRPTIILAAFAPLALLSATLFITQAPTATSAAPGQAVHASPADISPDASVREEGAEPALAGVWMRADIPPESDLVRFYYFHHEGNIGLYRYGKRCLNNTHSYDFGVSGDGRMQLLYKKTGRRAHIEYRLSRDAKGNEFLTLSPDPEEGRVVRYRKVRPPVDPDAATISSPDTDAGFDRMWMHAEKYATGGMGFDIYQMQPPGIDGRGVGWFHTGDFNDWSTESLHYRRVSPERTEDKTGRLSLAFSCRKERARTRYSERKEGKRRTITLKKDPRNYWHRQAYTDAGKSFMTLAYPSGSPELGGPLLVPLLLDE